jgi:hypothetical protein
MRVYATSVSEWVFLFNTEYADFECWGIPCSFIVIASTLSLSEIRLAPNYHQRNTHVRR